MSEQSSADATGLAPPPVGRPDRLVYFGTPEMAVPPLHALVDAGFDIALVVSQPDRRRGRGVALTPSPVKAAALDLGIAVTEHLQDIDMVHASLGVVVAFGRILPRSLLEQLPMVNLHFSLLPRWRGAAPVERALLAGDEDTGVCLMEVVEALDEGAVYDTARVAIGSHTTAAELREELVARGCELLVANLQRGLGDAAPQSGEITYAHKVTPEDLHLHWEEPASVLHRVVRVGGAWTTVHGQRLKIWRVRPVEARDVVDDARAVVGALNEGIVTCGAGALELIEVQVQGRARQDAAGWLRGARMPAGTLVGT